MEDEDGDDTPLRRSESIDFNNEPMIIEEIRDRNYEVDLVSSVTSNNIASPIRSNSPELIAHNMRLNTSSSIGTSKEISISHKNYLDGSSDGSPYQGKRKLTAVKEHPSKELSPESIQNTLNSDLSGALLSADSI